MSTRYAERSGASTLSIAGDASLSTRSTSLSTFIVRSVSTSASLSGRSASSGAGAGTFKRFLVTIIISKFEGKRTSSRKSGLATCCTVIFRKKFAFHEFDKNMDDLDVQLLRPVRIGSSGTADADIAHLLKRRARGARQADHLYPELTCCLGSKQDRLALSARANSEQNVTTAAMRLDISCEHLIVPKIICDTGEMGWITDSNGGNARTIPAKSSCKFFSEMHRVAHRAAVATGEGFPSVTER
ncbi:hypothetical protein SAMN05428966_109309 [Massilia sp. PDC64]|nr:hypothetical protein SAMN05428966_109309 [Massilia sp. PDC64]